MQWRIHCVCHIIIILLLLQTSVIDEMHCSEERQGHVTKRQWWTQVWRDTVSNICSGYERNAKRTTQSLQTTSLTWETVLELSERLIGYFTWCALTLCRWSPGDKGCKQTYIGLAYLDLLASDSTFLHIDQAQVMKCFLCLKFFRVWRSASTRRN